MTPFLRLCRIYPHKGLSGHSKALTDAARACTGPENGCFNPSERGVYG